jgi:translation initiation factor 5B
LLTKKQKEERAAADVRRKALVESGVVIEGLQAPAGAAPSSAKKFSYGARKKKPGPAKEASIDGASVVPSDREETPAPAVLEKEDAWDASSGDEAAAVKSPAGPASVPATPQAADKDEESMDDWEKDSDAEPSAKPGASMGIVF